MNEQYAAHVREMQERWQRIATEEGFDAVLVLAGSPRVSFLDDFEYAFRANPHFLAWLPLTHHPHCALLVRPGERPRLWYYQPEDFWHLPPTDPEAWWSDRFEIDVMGEPGAWRAALPGAGASLAVIGDETGPDGSIPGAEHNPEQLLMRLHLERTRKTGWEIDCMRRANRRAVAGHRAAERAFREGRSEFDIHLEYLRAVRQNDAELPYGSIVALNEHGAVLHYQQRERVAPEPSRSFLIDAGATEYAYASDITRTHAGDSGAFADLISALDTVQQDLAAAVGPGLDYRDLHLRAHLEISGVLRAAGIIRVAPEEAVSSGLSAVFFPHGLGHFIGLQTHDVAGLVDDHGAPVPRPDGHPFLRLTRKLEPGNVLTIEPGIYFIEPLLSRWKETADATAVDWAVVESLAPCGGIRIEDNVLVTREGAENLTRDAFAGQGG
ncbi:Xaa-Pro dipeptidase [Elongatibacter sediminis]|uniref:Xaa-Pro dipeptidase n=1 Tax=Elongatibacter sediminis TaxID=3119006 RepID=A0AAW9RAF5_9GAMM